eukprot:883430-Pelagomonas_calceolata.AAC.2
MLLCHQRGLLAGKISCCQTPSCKPPSSLCALQCTHHQPQSIDRIGCKGRPHHRFLCKHAHDIFMAVHTGTKLSSLLPQKQRARWTRATISTSKSSARDAVVLELGELLRFACFNIGKQCTASRSNYNSLKLLHYGPGAFCHAHHHAGCLVDYAAILVEAGYRAAAEMWPQ